MPDCAEIKLRLDYARNTLDRVMTGGAVRSVTDSDGSIIVYTAADPSRLISYIALLQAQYDSCTLGVPSTPIVTRPINFLF